MIGDVFEPEEVAVYDSSSVHDTDNNCFVYFASTIAMSAVKDTFQKPSQPTLAF